jgi:WD40 repeat protein
MDGRGFVSEIHEPSGDCDAARAIATGVSGLRAIVTDQQAILYDRAGRKAASHGHAGGTSVSFDPAGRRLAIAGAGEVAVYCLADRAGTGRDVRFPCAAAPKRITWAPDGARLAAAPETPTVPCWHLDGEQSDRPVSYFGRAFTVAWSYDGRHLVGAGDGSILCWNADRAFGRRTWFVPRSLAPMSGCRVTALACHPAHALAAAGYDDGCIMLADLDTGRDKVVRHATGAAVTALAWSDCGGRLAAANNSCEASLLDFSRLIRSN